MVTFTDISDQKECRVASPWGEPEICASAWQTKSKPISRLAARVQQSLALLGAGVGRSSRGDIFSRRANNRRRLRHRQRASTMNHLTMLGWRRIRARHRIPRCVANRIYTEMATQLQSSVPLGDMMRHSECFW